MTTFGLLLTMLGAASVAVSLMGLFERMERTCSRRTA
jgi:hypothetical protein